MNSLDFPFLIRNSFSINSLSVYLIWIPHKYFQFFLVLLQRHRKDVSNFDRQFTSEKNVFNAFGQKTFGQKTNSLSVYLIWIPHKYFQFFLVLLQRHRKDVSNFDRQFTSEKTDLTPTDKVFMMNLDQNEFAGFSFLNPEFVQHV